VKPINVCVVVFNRYDLLRNLARSITNSRVAVGRKVVIHVIDRGGQFDRVMDAFEGTPYPVGIVSLAGQSLPAAWNWFIQHVPEERILVSDDVEFYPEALETFASTPGDFLGIDDGKSSHFACFLVRDTCVRKVGLFDETLSPDYMYFEDCDYHYRMRLASVSVTGISCLHHWLAQSWEKKTPEQQAEHHVRFVAAQQNYVKKWGGEPGHERFTTPYEAVV
jgi:hypothetical protein